MVVNGKLRLEKDIVPFSFRRHVAFISLKHGFGLQQKRSSLGLHDAISPSSTSTVSISVVLAAAFTSDTHNPHGSNFRRRRIEGMLYFSIVDPYMCPGGNRQRYLWTTALLYLCWNITRVPSRSSREDNRRIEQTAGCMVCLPRQTYHGYRNMVSGRDRAERMS